MAEQSNHPGWDEEVLSQIGTVIAWEVEEGRHERAMAYAKKFFELYDGCQSPIETRIAGILASLFVKFLPHVAVDAQHPIGNYRVDFILTSERFAAKGIVVECDGHDFHERTKEQAARDRKRDRWLQNAGYLVLRFTGSEITSALGDVAAELLASIRSQSGRANG